MADLFAIHVPVLELVLRGTLVYWLLFAIFRFILRRDVGAVGIADILLLVIVADAAQNAMSGGYDTFAEGAILVLTIVGGTGCWTCFHGDSSWCAVLRRRRGSRWFATAWLQLRNMRREYITMQELEEKLREQGIEQLSGVKMAYLEGDGQISIIQARSGRRSRAHAAKPRSSADVSPGPAGTRPGKPLPRARPVDRPPHRACDSSRSAVRVARGRSWSSMSARSGWASDRRPASVPMASAGAPVLTRPARTRSRPSRMTLETLSFPGVHGSIIIARLSDASSDAADGAL